jgi:hypothetical protein
MKKYVCIKQADQTSGWVDVKAVLWIAFSISNAVVSLIEGDG